MKTIIHLPSWEAIQQVPNDIIAISHLITYSVQTMNGEYAPRVVVFKNRMGNEGISISYEQLQILQDAVVNDKPVPEFMKSNCQKAQEICDELRNDRNSNSQKTIQSRLKKLESELFPAGHCYSINSVNTPTNADRLSRIEKKLGVVQSPGDTLGRLETCEFHLKNTHWRLRKLDDEIYPTTKDVEGMPFTTTYDGWMKRLEDKLGVDLAFTSIDHRLKHIEDAWACTKAAYNGKWNPSIDRMESLEVRITKLEDALIPEGFPTDPTNPELAIMRLDRLQKKVGIQHPPWSLESQIEQLEYHVYHNITKWKQPSYVAKYHIGDTLEFHNEYGKVTKKIVGIEIGNGQLYYHVTGDNPSYLFCESVDKDTLSIYKVTPKEQFFPEFDC